MATTVSAVSVPRVLQRERADPRGSRRRRRRRRRRRPPGSGRRRRRTRCPRRRRARRPRPRSAVQVGRAAAVVDVLAVRRGRDRDDLGAGPAQYRRARPRRRRRARSRPPAAARPAGAGSVASRWSAYRSAASGRSRTRPTPAPGRAGPALAEPGLDLVLDRVGQLVPAAGEELDPVVRHRVVAGGQHHAEVGVERRRPGARPPAWAARRARSTSAPALVSPATTAASSISPLARPSRPTRPRAAADRPSARTARARPATATPSASSGVRSALANPARRRYRTAVPCATSVDRAPPKAPAFRKPGGGIQRLLYWGALRAFFRPYFLRSFTRGSRVRKPAFFSAGRSSGSISISARAIAELQRAGLAGDAAALEAARSRRTARPSPGSPAARGSAAGAPCSGSTPRACGR